MKKKTKSSELAEMFSVSHARGMEAIIKAQLITAVLKKIEKDGITHGAIAQKAELSRSTVTGILSGSLQKVTIDRILRIVEAVGLVADVRVRKAA